MKKFLLLSILAVICSTFFNLNAQQTDVVTGINNPWYMALNGSDLYVAVTGENKIVKVDLSANPVTSRDFATGLNNPVGLAIKDNQLYIQERIGNKISRIDLATENKIDLVMGLPIYVYQMAFKGNDLYFADFLGNKISKLDVTNPTVITKVLDISGPQGIALKGNELYVSSTSLGKIVKLDLATGSKLDVVGGLSSPAAIHLDNNELYIVGSGAGKVSKIIDVTASPIVTTTVYKKVEIVSTILIYRDELYMASTTRGRIIKMSLCLGKLTVEKTGGTLTVPNVSGVTYQWVDCSAGFSAKSGSTTTSFTPTKNSSYGVVTTRIDKGCKDTSLCTLVCIANKPIVTKRRDTLSITAVNNATYKWLNCGTNMAVGSATANSFIPTESGNYAVELTRSSGCKDTSLCTLVCVTNRPTVTKAGTTLTSTTETGATYSWLDCATNMEVGTATTNSYTPAVTGDYAVKLTSAIGCIDTSLCKRVTVCPPSPPMVTKAGTTLTSTTETGATYRWLDCGNNNKAILGETTNSYTPTVSGNYAVELTKTDDCADVSSCTVVCIASKPTVTKTSTTLTSSTETGATYRWLDCSSNMEIGGATSETYTPTVSGTYAVELTTKDGCIDTSVCIKFCFIDKPLVTGRTGAGTGLTTAIVTGVTYKWLSCNNTNKSIAGATTETYIATASGDYAVEVTKSNGCRDTSVCASVTVSVTKSTTTLATGFDSHHYLVAKDGYIYAADFVGTGTVYKMDIRNQLPVDKGTLSSVAVGPVGLAIKDNDLYIGEFSTNKISKIDLATEDRTDVLAVGAGLNRPYGIAFKGNDLYIADFLGNRISKIDVTANPIVRTNVITGLLGPNGIAFKGNDLYIAEYNANKVSKIDVTASPIVKTDVIGGLSTPSGLFFDNDDLYISERKANQISKVDVTNPSVKTAFITGLSEPVGIMVYGGYLYIVEQTTNKISRLPFNPCTPDKPMVTKTGTTLTTPTDAGAVYRWLGCGDNMAVNGATTATYTPTVSGNYAVELIRSNGCVDTSLCKIVCIPSKPLVTKLGAKLTTPTVNQATYRWLDCATNTVIGGATSETYTATVTGDYAVELTTKEGCVDTSLCTRVTVCPPSVPMVRKTGSTLTTDIVTGATYKWVDCGNNMVVSGATTETYTPTVSGNYAVEVTRTNACADVSVCTLVCIANKPIVTKRRDTLTVPAVTGAMYKWIDCGTNMAVGSATTNSFIATVSGSYAVELTSAIGCIDTSVCTVVCVANKPIVTKRRDTLITATVTGATYSWLDCGTNMAVGSATANLFIPTVSGSYAVELTSDIGCIDTSVCTVVCVANPPIVTKRRDTLIAPTINGVVYRWLDCGEMNAVIGGATGEKYIATVSGNYAVELTGSNGCKDTSVCTVVCIPSKPLVTKLGAKLTTPTVNQATYRWLDCATNTVIGGATSKTYTATVTGDYAVELTTKEGCVDTSLCTKVTVCPPSAPMVRKTGSTLTTDIVTGATYKWVDCGNNMVVSGATTATYTATASGNYAVEVTRTNACADVSVCTLVCIANKPTVTKTGATLTTATVSGATYRWLDCATNMVITGETSETYTATVSGSYAVELTSAIGCIDTSVCALVCFSNKPPAGLIGKVLSTNAVNGATYKWLSCDNANKPIAGATIENYTVIASGNYAVEVTKSNGCKDTSSCIFTTISVTKPTTTLATGFNVHHYLAAKDGYIYTANFAGTGTVHKMDIRNQLPVNLETLSSAAVGPVGLAIKDNELYIGEYTTNKISKIDLATGTRTDVLASGTGLNQPYGIAFKGNDLYIADYGGKISKIDVTANPIVRTDVITGLSGPNGIAFKGNDLYIAEYNANKVSKIDVTASSIVKTDVIVGLNSPAGLFFDNNDLYISERKANQISKVDITNPSVKTAFITGLSDPVGIMVYGDYLYIVEQTANKISRLPFNPCTPDKPIVTKTGTTLTTPIVSGAVYRWLDCGNNNPVAGATTETYTVTVKGSYAVELIRSNGCVDTSVCKVVCIPSKPSVTKLGATLTVPTVNGATYSWLDCATNMAVGSATTESFTPTVTGDYAVELTTQDGCVDTSLCTTVTVCSPNPPMVRKTGSTLTTDIVTGATYKWIDCGTNMAVGSATTNSFTPTVSGNYAVELTRTNGCADVSVCTIVCVANKPIVTKRRDTLTAPTVTGATYKWIDCGTNMAVGSATTNSFIATVSGSYAVELTSAIGCIDTSVCTVVCIANKPIVTKRRDTLTVPAVTGATYKWIDCGTNMAVGSATTNLFMATVSGSYAVELTSAIGCIDTSVCTVVCIANKPIVTKRRDTLTVPAVTGAMYKWIDCGTNMAVGSATANLFIPTVSGSYAVELTGSNGCKDTSVCTVVCIPSKPLVTKLGARLTAPTLAGATYRWLDCATNMEIGSATTNSYTPTVTGDYEVELTTKEGCIDTSLCTRVTVCPPSVPIVMKTGATLTAPTVNGATYKWVDCGNNNMVVSGATTATYTATVSGSYAVELTRANACADVSVCTVVCIANKPIVTKRRDTLTAPTVTGATYKWIDCGTNMAVGSATTNSFIATVSGSYALELTTQDGCKDTSLCTVVCVASKPTVMVAGATLTAPTLAGAMYKWIDCGTNMAVGSATTNLFMATVSGSYAVELTASNGCIDTSICTSVTVSVTKPTVTVATGFDANHYLVAKDGYIYTANFVGTGTVYKMDTRDQLPINKAMLSSVAVGPVGLAIKDNDLYIGEYTTNKISKIDLATGTRTDVLAAGTGLDRPYEIAFKGNDLYIADYGGKVSKIDVTANPIVRTDVITGLSGPNGIAFKGNDLYIAEYTGGKVSKIDVTANPIVKTDVIIGLNTPSGLLFDNNDLYISERKANQISKIDITNPSVKTAFITGLSEPVGMMVYGSYLYFVEQTANKISRLPFNPCTPDKPIVTKTGTMLTTPVVAGALYRWLDCGDNNKPVVGATTESFTPTVGGSYAVELIRSGGCVDTSICITITVGLIENTFATSLKLYPNPTSDKVTIELGNNYNDIVVEITNVLGQVITRKSVTTITNHKMVVPINASKGIYFVRIQAKEGTASFRVVKE